MAPSFDLESWLETHDRPFVVIDEGLRVAGVNRAYERHFRLDRAAILGRPCHEVVHRRKLPCDQEGEECPLAHARATGQPHSCLHAHYDGAGEIRWVRVNLHPLVAADGRRYYGEVTEELADPERCGAPGLERRRMVGRSPRFLRMVEQLAAAAAVDAPVLLLGETGTGKELAARFLHDHSSRAHRTFLCLDCTAVVESLFESELFGHERGAFTGSV
ncbi:MAG: PAS domain-containing protein, partial [Nitrospirae bacterium]